MLIKLNKQDYELFCQFNINRFLEICKIEILDEETILYVNQDKKGKFQLILSDEIWRNGMDDNDNATDLGWKFFKLQDRILDQIASQ